MRRVRGLWLTIPFPDPHAHQTRPKTVNVNWTPDLPRYTKSVMGDQLKRVKEAVLKMDPHGLFRTKYLSEVFDLPY